MADIPPSPLEAETKRASGVEARRGRPAPKFVTGSLLRHILVMTGAGAVGLMAIFIGDLANIYFLSLTGDENIVAAVGYASAILFFSTSIGIGLAIAATSLVSPALGAGRRSAARRLSVHAHLLTILVSAALSVVLWLAIDPLLKLMGADGPTLDLARRYLMILLPSLPMLACGMTSSAVLRSVGDANRAMHVTLAGAIANTLLDLLLIVHWKMGIEGAAVASLLARAVVMGIGLYGVIGVHKLMGRARLVTFKADARAFALVAVPAMLTNVATPVGNAFVTQAMSGQGEGAVAGWAIVGRLIPVAFGAIYALSGSVGPIIGQNYGARLPARMRDVLTLSLAVSAAFSLAAWVLLAIGAEPLARLFHPGPQAEALIVFFCRWLAPLFIFLAAMFVANAAFNTLGRAHISTALNWGRATLGTIPFVYMGAAWGGANGALAGSLIGAAPFGVLAVWVAYRLIADLGAKMPN